MKRFSVLILVFLGVLFNTQAQLVSFPGAEGFGKYAVGGRGGEVVAVTSLEDYKSTDTPIEGSLRWALEQHVTTTYVYKDASNPSYPVTDYTPLTIVFKVSGTIWLKEDLKVKRDSLTIAGQTAPGDGICIAGRSMLFNGATGGEMFYWGPRRKDLIVRYLRFRPGVPKDEDGLPTSSFVTYGTDIENYENVIMDHCTAGWANEECLAIYDTKNTTVQWCLFSEGLYDAYHPKDYRSYGGVWGGQFGSYHHNAIVHNVSRTCAFNGARAHDTLAVVEYRNNVVYNWGNSDACYGGAVEISGGKSEINLMNNYYKKGPALSVSLTPSAINKGHRLVYLYDDVNDSNHQGTGQHYVHGNYVNEYPTITASNWEFGVQFKYWEIGDTTTTFPLFRLNSPSTEVAAILPSTLESATESYAKVLDSVGAILPLRDYHDKRIVNEIANGTATGSGIYGTNKGIIDDPDKVGGWPVLYTGDVPLDTDEDGMSDIFEMANALNINDPSDRNTLAPSGYTWLEEYLNSITANTGFIQTPFNLESSINTSDQVELNWVDNSDNETGFEIQKAIKGTSTFVSVDTVAADIESYTDTATIDDYVYRIRAYNVSDSSAFTDEVYFLSAPTNLSYIESNSTLVFSWEDNASSETNYKVYRSVANDNNFILIATLDPNTISYTDQEMTDSTAYDYKVNAVYNTFTSDSSNEIEASITVAPASNISGSLNASNYPVVTWNDNSFVEDGYIIDRMGFDNFQTITIDTVAANLMTYTDESVNSSTIYRYFISILKDGVKYSNFSTYYQVAVPVSVQINEIDGLQVFPVPVKKDLNVNANQEIETITIYSSIGTLLNVYEVNNKQMKISMGNYPQGLYSILVKAKNGNQSVVKIIK